MKEQLARLQFYLIDDNKIDLRIHEKLLEYSNLAECVLVFQNGQDALQHIRHNTRIEPYAIILLDIQMPHMNGFQFVDAFLELPKHKQRDYKIIMVSSTIDPQELHSVQSNALDILFLPKPLNPSSIKSIMQEWQK